ncbi:hypothetical protein NC651_028253 [Populus alba x Populus x berolinensis]|nr:hypothetical protein NC651_028253 [Populus alba x Populus x berolinensis]
MGDIGQLASPNSNRIENLCQEILIQIPDELESSFPSEQCIYRVPAALRDLNEAAFTPRVISIGPIHHNNAKLKAMEVQKRRYMKEFFELRVKKEKRRTLLTALLSTILEKEVDICRRYVADTSEFISELNGDQFAKMVLLDAVFIFELFLRNEEYLCDNSKYQDDFIIGKPWLRAAIRRDLILLENQLPFSTLNELFELARSTIACNSLMDLSFQYFEKYKKKYKPSKTILHFTDLLRCFLSFKHPDLKLGNGGPIKTLYSATMLQQAGIKFKAMPGESLLDIRAWKPLSKEEPIVEKKGELHMPPLEIDNNTECLLRNLMVFEQLHYPGEEHICRYVKLLDSLVDVDKDVDLLIENKVIISKLGDSDAVAKLINTLCREMVEISSSFDSLSKLLNDYYESSWNKNKTYLLSVYFKNVWIGTGTVAGSLFLAIALTRFILYFVR